MNSSPDVNELATALSAAQAVMESAKKGSLNPHFHSKYADLASVVDAIRKPFADHGLSYVQLPLATGAEEVAVETVLLHRSGQWISSVFAIPVSRPDAHGRMSALTYCRRGSLAAIAGVAPEDDDGNAASGAGTPKRPAREKAPEETSDIEVPVHLEDRDALLGKIKGVADRLKLKGAERAALWNEFCGATATPETADVSALAGLLERLRTLQAG